MALQTTTIQDICDKVAKQYSVLEDAVVTIEADNPDYFPLVTQDDDFDFELKMNPALIKGDDWNVPDLVKASPLKSICGGLLNYFSTSHTYNQIEYVGSLDNYLYVNGMTVSKNFADALYYSTGYVMCGVVVDNSVAFTFGEFGEDENGDPFFTSIGSYQTDDLNAPYGLHNGKTTYAPTSRVEVEIVSADSPINFDINLICKDLNGDTFTFQQNLSGEEGDTITLNLTEEITGVSGLATPYSGNANDLLRIKTLPSEV